MHLVIEPGGVVRCVYAEGIDLSALGLPSIRRRVSRQPGRCCDAGCDPPDLMSPP